MEEPITQKQNLEVSGEIDDIFSSFDTEYKKLRDRIADDLNDYKSSLQGEKNRAEELRRKMPARTVLEAMLPLLSEINNDVIDATNLDDLKGTIAVRYRQLELALKSIGVTLQGYKRNDYIGDNEKTNGGSVSTDNPDLHHRVAKTTSIGCVIKGEEDNPILASVDIFVYKAPEKKAADIQFPVSPLTQVDKRGFPVSQDEDKKRQFEMEQFPRRDVRINNPDAILMEKKQLIELQRNFLIQLNDGSTITLIRAGDVRKYDTISKITVPYECQGKSGFIYFGTNKLLEVSFSALHQEYIYYRFVINVECKKLELLQLNDDTRKYEVKKECPIKIIKQ